MTTPSTSSAPDRSSFPPRPRSIYVPSEDPRKELREAVDAILSDGLMAFLSLLLVPIILLPLFVTLPSATQSLLNAGDVTIIAFFVVEYAAKLYLADDRRAFARSPWHLLDLAVILLSFVSYLPFLGLRGRGSAILLLRLLRLPRVFAVAGRATERRLGPKDSVEAAPAPRPEVRILRVAPSGTPDPQPLTWEELERHLADDEAEWIHIANASEETSLRLSGLLGISEAQLRLRQVDELHPHVGRVQRTSLLFVQTGEIRYPTKPQEFVTIARKGAVIILRGPKILSVAPHGGDIFARARTALERPRTDAGPFALVVLPELLDSLLRDYREMFAEIEGEVAAIGAIPRSHLPNDFLARAYQLSKATQRLASSVVHLRVLLGRLGSGAVPLEGATEANRDTFAALGEETNYLSEIASDVTESLGHLTDVYVNQSSFDTNRILKVLAVLTALALIPGTIGGLLGIDGPYDFILWEVVLFAGLGMLFAGYCFLKLGWLSA